MQVLGEQSVEAIEAVEGNNERNEFSSKCIIEQSGFRVLGASDNLFMLLTTC